MALLQAVLEFLFEVDLVNDPADTLAFRDALGTCYEISDLWFVLMDAGNICSGLRLDERI
jgi:hypothetical protein